MKNATIIYSRLITSLHVHVNIVCKISYEANLVTKINEGSHFEVDLNKWCGS